MAEHRLISLTRFLGVGYGSKMQNRYFDYQTAIDFHKVTPMSQHLCSYLLSELSLLPKATSSPKKRPQSTETSPNAQRPTSPHLLTSSTSAHSSRRLLQILDHMHNPNPLSIRTPHAILPPTPHIPTPLIQPHPRQRRPHLQPLKPVRLLAALRRPRLAVPHHHRPEAAPRERRRGEDCSDRGPVCQRVALRGHAQGGGRVRAAVQGLPEGPAAAGGDCGGGGDGVEDVVRSAWGVSRGLTLTIGSRGSWC